MMDVPYGIERPMQQVFKFVINEPDIDYRIGWIYITVRQYGDTDMYFYVDNGGKIYFDPTLDDGISAESRLAGTPIAAEAQEERDKLQLKPKKVTPLPAPSSLGPRDGPTPEYYQAFADQLLAQHPGEHYEQWLFDRNFTRSWVYDFLEAMPHLHYDPDLAAQLAKHVPTYS